MDFVSYLSHRLFCLGIAKIQLRSCLWLNFENGWKFRYSHSTQTIRVEFTWETTYGGDEITGTMALLMVGAKTI